MLEFLYNQKSKENIILKNDSQIVCSKDLRQYIQNNIPILKTKKKNIVLLTEDILAFTINFFAAILTNKTIYLTDNIYQLEDLEPDFDILKSYNKDILPSEIELPKINPDNILIKLMTSGSSGNPKGITKSLTNLISEAQDIEDTFNFKSERLLVSSSTTFAHLFGLTFGFMFPLCNNHIINLNKIDYPDRIDGENVFLVSTPTFLETIKKNQITLNNTKYIVSAGAKLNDETFEYLENFSNVIEIYGSTETGVIGYRKHYTEQGFTGFKNVKINALENSTLIQTPYSYERNIQINDKLEVCNDKIFLKERTDRLLKIQEKRVSAELLENYLNTHEFISENYCFKTSDKIGCLCALSESGRKFLLENGNLELSKYLKSFLKEKQEVVPQKWKFTDELPKTITGKIDKKHIEHLFGINLSFPTILDRTKRENSITYKLYFNKNCNFYSGHFPDFPITPGVVQLYLAGFLGESAFERKLIDGQIRRIKFSNIINAGDIVYLKLILKESSVSFEYSSNNKIFSSGVFSCKNIFEGVSL